VARKESGSQPPLRKRTSGTGITGAAVPAQQRSGGAVQPYQSGSVRAGAAPGRSDPAAKTNVEIEECE
jgi:hypothetical protein